MTIAGTSSTTPSLVVKGLISGITTTAVINALLASYEAPIKDLTSQQSGLNVQAQDLRKISSDFQSLFASAQAISHKSSWNLTSATSSNETAANAVSGPGAQKGSLSIDVTQLAQANVLASRYGATSVGQTVTSATSMLLSTGIQALGFSSLSPSSALGLGPYTLSVDQASGAARVTGTVPAASTTITATNDAISLAVNGTTYTLTLATGTYTPSQLATALNTAAKAAGAAVTASVAPTGGLRLATVRQGSAATLSVSGGSALGSLGLTAGKSGSGVNAVVTVGGVKTTLTSLTPNKALSLGAPGTSTITATVGASPAPDGSLVSSGTAHLADVSTGNGSLSDVVAAINSSGLAMTASAVKTSSGAYVLQISANGTGLVGEASVDPTAFSGSVLGPLETLIAAQTATVKVGGATGYAVSSSTDAFDTLLPGTVVTVAGLGQTTITVSSNATGEAGAVTAFVSAANKALADIQKYAGYTTSTKTGGPLMGNPVVSNLREQILSTIATTTGSSSLGNLSDVGITLNKTGLLSFTKSKFLSAFGSDPTATEALFIQDGTFSPSIAAYSGEVTLASAGTLTPSGTFQVRVSHSATQAQDVGTTVATGKVSVAETLTVTMGTTTVKYTTTAGETLAQIASGLDTAFGTKTMPLSAEVVGGTKLQLTSNAYGSSASFTVSSTAVGAGSTGLGGATATSPTTYVGTNVAGTIGGIAASGAGQVLTAPANSSLDGMAVIVTAAGITATTLVGTLTYSPGAAQRIASLADRATNPVNGSLVGAVTSLTEQATGLNAQIALYQRLESSQRASLRQEFARMEATLGRLKAESATLTGAIAKLP